MNQKGRVKFFHSEKGYGFIIPEAGVRDHYVRRENIIPISKTGIPGLYEGQEVEYLLEKQSDRQPEAFQVKGVVPRLGGIVIDFDDQDGEGEIRLDQDGTVVAVNYRDIFSPTEKRKYLAIGSPVELEVERIKGEAHARRVLQLDPRRPLERFAKLPYFDRAIEFLAERLAQYEIWDYKDNPEGGYPILRSYIQDTFARIEEERKICFAQDSSGHKFACFNTGLVTDLQQEILALFEENREKKQPWDPSWFFKVFLPTSDRRTAPFACDFALANYFDDARDLVLDWRLRIEQNAEHIIRHRAYRFPESLRSNESSRRGAFEAAFRDALRRVRRNYKAAVPQYHRGSIQLLLPLALENPPQVDRALVLSRLENIYRAHTIFPLDWAYRNARLLAKPDREWLVP